MKKLLMLAGVLILSVAVEARAGEAQSVPVDVLFMNHGPLRSTINQLKERFAKFDGKIVIAWYDFDKKESEKFKKARGVTAHIPLVIWINGNHTFLINGREVAFIGFPTGFGPAQFQGKWTFDDVEFILAEATGAK